MTSLIIHEYSEWKKGEDARYWRHLTVEDLRVFDVHPCKCGRQPKALIRHSANDGRTYVDVKCPKCGAHSPVCSPDMGVDDLVALAFDQWNDWEAAQ